MKWKRSAKWPETKLLKLCIKVSNYFGGFFVSSIENLYLVWFWFISKATPRNDSKFQRDFRDFVSSHEAFIFRRLSATEYLS